VKGFVGDGELAAGLHRLARHLPVFEAPGFTFGSWEPSREREDGIIVLGWYVPGPEAEAFLADLGGWITPFDWMAWAASPEGQALLGHPDAVASASADDLRKLLTTYVRGERFGDGTLENAFMSGMLTAIMRRAGVLAAELEHAR
jgi:Family of unknown function (DUF6508)